MSDQQGSRPTDPTTTDTFRVGTPTHSTELYEAGFSTLGERPLGGVAMARTIDEARQRLADMLLFANPAAPTTADIVAFHRAETVDHYHGTAGDILAKVNTGTPGRTVIARPLTTSSAAAAAAADGQRGTVMCLTLTNATTFLDHSPISPPDRSRVEIHYNSQENRYDVAMVSQRYIEVLEPEAMSAIDRLVGRQDPHPLVETDETYFDAPQTRPVPAYKPANRFAAEC